jgi:hypothetical protein
MNNSVQDISISPEAGRTSGSVNCQRSGKNPVRNRKINSLTIQKDCLTINIINLLKVNLRIKHGLRDFCLINFLSHPGKAGIRLKAILLESYLRDV